MKSDVLLLATALWLIPTAASAQGATAPSSDNARSSDQPLFEDIVVTAQRQEQSLQKVPVAVTVFSGDALARANATTINDLAPMTPSLQISNFVGRPAMLQLSLRAQRQSDTRIVADPSVGLYINEVPINRTYGTGITAFLDVTSVQVLKGPQGTLFGRNTTGGALLIVPQGPKDTFEGKVMVGYGNHNLLEATAVVNAPIGDGVALRLAAAGADRDGAIKNFAAGGDQGGLHHLALRASLKAALGSNITTTFIGDYFGNDAAGRAGTTTALRPGSPPDTSATTGPIYRAYLAAQAVRPFYSVETNSALYDRGYAFGITNVTVADVSPSLSLKNIVAFRHTNNSQLIDVEGTLALFSTQVYRDNIHQLSEELQLHYKSNLVDFIGGLFLFDEEGTTVVNNSTTLLQYTGAHNSAQSVYGQATWHLDDKLDLITGGRWTWDRRTIDARNQLPVAPFTCFELSADTGGVPLNPCQVERAKRFNSPTWNVSLNYRLTPDQMIYLAHRHGYRAGGFTVTPLTPAAFTPYRPEKVNDVEFGYKGDIPLGGNAAIRFDVAAYYTWYKDIQRTITKDLSSTPGTPFLISLITNAASARIYGLEFESTLKPTRNLSISASYTYTHARYDQFFADGPGGTKLNFSNFRFPVTPEHKGSLSVRYDVPLDTAGDLSFQGTISRQSDINLEVTESPGGSQAPYTLLDASVNWDRFIRDNLTLRVWAKNLTNTKYYTGGSNLYNTSGINIGYFGEPRTFGMQVSAKF